MSLCERIIANLNSKEQQVALDKLNRDNRKILSLQKRRRRIAAARQEEELQVNLQGE